MHIIQIMLRNYTQHTPLLPKTNANNDSLTAKLYMVSVHRNNI